MSHAKFRLITRADFDGVVCGALFQEMDMIDEVVFAEPFDMQAGRVAVSGRDITANLPYVEGVHLCFDHHASELTRIGGDRPHRIIDPNAPSAARVVYNHFGGKTKFSAIPDGLIEAVDKADSADYTEEDILAPDKWTLLNFIVDPRTGLSRFKDFSTSTEEFMIDLMTYCRHHPIDELMRLPEILERVQRYEEHEERAEHQIVRCATVHGGLLAIDFRRETLLYATNRFTPYALYPQCSLSLHLINEEEPGRVHFSMGHSILNRTSKIDVGKLMLEFGGGGHKVAGGCYVPEANAEGVLNQLIARVAGG